MLLYKRTGGAAATSMRENARQSHLSARNFVIVKIIQLKGFNEKLCILL